MATRCGTCDSSSCKTLALWTAEQRGISLSHGVISVKLLSDSCKLLGGGKNKARTTLHVEVGGSTRCALGGADSAGFQLSHQNTRHLFHRCESFSRFLKIILSGC